MLDENLPTFTLKPSLSGTKHHNEFYLTHYGSQPEPAYHLEHADPASPSPAQKNCYAAALFDSYNPEVLFGEVLARPEWSKAEAASGSGGSGGIPPAPQPMLPGEFVVQLYNPDQQVRVEVKSPKWGGSDSYEFSLPQDTFRTPSLSSLDKSASDPASLEVTPRINFVWRKDGRLNKDLTCFMTGKSTDVKQKKKSKDPDISIALWKRGEELTIYEPNLGRIEMEDPKGLEVVLILSATVIKDLYFSPKDQLRDVFNISDTPTSPRKLSAGGRKVSNPKSMYGTSGLSPPPAGDPNANKRHSLPKLQTGPQNQALYNTSNSSYNAAPPFADPRAQWESEAETARLKAQVEQEKAEAQRRRKEQDKKDEAERKRLQKMVEEEEKAARKNQAAIDKETERLRKLYGVKPIPQYQSNQARPSVPPRPQPGPSGYSYPGGSSGGGAPTNYYSARQVHARPYLAAPRPTVGSNGLLTGPSASAQNLTMSGGAGPRPVSSNGLPIPGGQGQNVRKKSSFWR